MNTSMLLGWTITVVDQRRTVRLITICHGYFANKLLTTTPEGKSSITTIYPARHVPLANDNRFSWKRLNKLAGQQQIGETPCAR